MFSDATRGLVLWRKIKTTLRDDSPLLLILHTLVQQYKDSEPNYIPAYEVENMLDRLSIAKELVWKDLVDLTCFDFSVFTLQFQFIDGDDQFDIDSDIIQDVLRGNAVFVGGCEYSADVASNCIYPYFMPTNKFHWLVSAESFLPCRT